jgi:hypothetical protein
MSEPLNDEGASGSDDIILTMSEGALRKLGWRADDRITYVKREDGTLVLKRAEAPKPAEQATEPVVTETTVTSEPVIDDPAPEPAQEPVVAEIVAQPEVTSGEVDEA